MKAREGAASTGRRRRRPIRHLPRRPGFWRKHGVKLLAGALVAFLIGEIAYLWTWTSVLPVLRPSPQFTMTDMFDRPLSFRSLTGKVRLVTFFYTRCRDLCPLATASLARIAGRLSAQGQFGTRVAFLSISFDPAHDTPAALLAYAREFHADSRGWYFLRASVPVTDAVLSGFGFSPAQLSAGMSNHQEVTLLVDQNGNVRKVYTTARLPQDQVVADIENLLSSPVVS